MTSWTHRGHLRLWVCPAGSHGANNASTGIHVKVPPRQDDLGPAAGLSHKLGGVGLERAAYRLTEIHTKREGRSACERLMLRENNLEEHVCHLRTWTWCREDPAGWSCEETPGSAGCHTLNELQHSGPQQAVGLDGPPPPPLAAAEPSSTAAPTPPAGRRWWPGEGPPRNLPAGRRDMRRQIWPSTGTEHFTLNSSDFSNKF